MLSAMPHRALLVLPLLLAACGSELEPAPADAGAHLDATSTDTLVQPDAGAELDAAALPDADVDAGALDCRQEYFDCRRARIASECPDGGSLCQRVADQRCLVGWCSAEGCLQACSTGQCELACAQAADDKATSCLATCPTNWPNACTEACSAQVQQDRAACTADPCGVVRMLAP